MRFCLSVCLSVCLSFSRAHCVTSVSVCCAQTRLKIKELRLTGRLCGPLFFLRCVWPQYHRVRYGRRWRLPERFFSRLLSCQARGCCVSALAWLRWYILCYYLFAHCPYPGTHVPSRNVVSDSKFDCTTGHLPFEMSCSFRYQVLAQLVSFRYWKNRGLQYEVYFLPDQLHEKVTSLHLRALQPAPPSGGLFDTKS